MLIIRSKAIKLNAELHPETRNKITNVKAQMSNKATIITKGKAAHVLKILPFS